MKLSRSRLSGRQRARLVEHFVAGTPARSAAQLVGVNRNTARLFYHRVRELIARRLAQSEPAGPALARGLPAAPGAPLLALFKRNGKILATMRPASEPPDALIYDDAPRDHASVAAAQLRLQRGEHAGVNTIDNFWSQAQRHLRRYNGVPRRHLALFLQECVWRFNYGPPALLRETLSRWIARASRR